MRVRLLALTSVLLAAWPTAGFAENRGVIAGLDIGLGTARGSSKTTDGGAPFAGGGIAGDVEFGTATAIGGHIGYRVDPALSLTLSYRHVRGDIRWSADFPQIGAMSRFEGAAISNVILGNVAYTLPISRAVGVDLGAGAGLTINRLSRVNETDGSTGIFLSQVASRSKIYPAARVAAGMHYWIMPGAALGVDAAFGYAGGFVTGSTRSGNLGITAINPYRIGNVWRADIGASFRVAL